METLTDVPHGRAALDAATLVARHPPRPRHANKRAVFELVAPPGATHDGTITVSRWPQRAVPHDVAWQKSSTVVELRRDVFTYDPPPPGRVERHLNFAHAILFVAYAGPLFAQDEVHVAEPPALASVRGACASEGDVGRGGRPQRASRQASTSITRSTGATSPTTKRRPSGEKAPHGAGISRRVSPTRQGAPRVTKSTFHAS
jgi:hypothetical protein